MTSVNMWALLTPKGKILKDTVAATRQECWERGFWAVSSRQGDGWQQLYWKRWDESIRSARRLGYKIRRVSVIAQVIP